MSYHRYRDLYDEVRRKISMSLGVDYYAMTAKLREDSPKNSRKKEVVCPVTGKMTDHQYGLSAEAWGLIEDGLKWRKYMQEQETKSFKFRDGHSINTSKAYLDRPQGPEDEGRLRSFPSSYTSLTRWIFNAMSRPVRDLGYGEKAELLLDPGRSSARWLQVDLTEGEAFAVRRLIMAVEDAYESRYQEGYNRGGSILHRMARGELDIEQTDKALDRRNV